MNRFVRCFSAVTTGLVIAAAVAGCGTGQISQTANQEPAVNGTAGVLKELSLRNVHIQAEQTGDSIPAGEKVDLIFFASNQSPDVTDELTSITSDIGKVAVKLPGPAVLAPGSALSVVAPDALKSAQAVRDISPVTVTTATVTLDKSIQNGLTYKVTFTFKGAGSIDLDVPISAGTKKVPPPAGDD